MPSAPRFSVGETLTAAKLNALSELAAAAFRGGARLQRDRFGRSYFEAVVVGAPNPAAPDWPENIAYAVMIAGVPSSRTAGLKPSVGRPAVGRQCKIWPALVGSLCAVIRTSDTEGEPRWGLEIAHGGEDDTGGADGLRGERLAFGPPCDDDGGGDDDGDGPPPDIIDGGGPPPPPPGPKPGPLPGPGGGPPPNEHLARGAGGQEMETIRITGDHAEVQARLSTAELAAAEKFRVPRVRGGRLGAIQAGGTWAATLTVKFYTGLLGPFDFSTPKTLTPAAPHVAFTEAEMLGVTDIEVRQSGAADAAGALVLIGGAFWLEQPAEVVRFRVPAQALEVRHARPVDGGSVGYTAGAGGGSGGPGGPGAPPGHGGGIGGGVGGGFATP